MRYSINIILCKSLSLNKVIFFCFTKLQCLFYLLGLAKKKESKLLHFMPIDMKVNLFLLGTFSSIVCLTFSYLEKPNQLLPCRGKLTKIGSLFLLIAV